MPKTSDLTFEAFERSFPVDTSNLFFRFKVEDDQHGYVWRDITTGSHKLPIDRESIITVKVLKLDSVSTVKRQYYLRRKKSVEIKPPAKPPKLRQPQAEPSAANVPKVRPPPQKSPIERVSENTKPTTPQATAQPKPNIPQATVHSQPVADMLDFGGSAGLSSSSKGAAQPFMETAPVVSREELVMKRETEKAEKIKEALDFKREVIIILSNYCSIIC